MNRVQEDQTIVTHCYKPMTLENLAYQPSKFIRFLTIENYTFVTDKSFSKRKLN